MDIWHGRRSFRKYLCSIGIYVFMSEQAVMVFWSSS